MDDIFLIVLYDDDIGGGYIDEDTTAFTSEEAARDALYDMQKLWNRNGVPDDGYDVIRLKVK